MPEAVIVSTARTPIGRAFKGSLAAERPDDMVAQVVSQALAKIPQLDPATIDDLLLGCGSPGGEQGFNMARVVAVLLGLDTVPGATVTRYCASSLQTTRMAAHAVRAGEGDVFVSAGVESCSSYTKGESDSIPGTMNPVFDEARERTLAASGGAAGWTDPRLTGELPDVYVEMGQTAENVALAHGVTRAEMDEYALLSQRRTADARGFWESDITPYRRADGTIVSADDSPRPRTTAEALAGLRPAFRPDGRVTAGNCCPLSDGAAALVVMSDTRARELGITPLARVVSTAVTGLSPEIMGMGPVAATRRALGIAGLSIGGIDLFELNEAFAAQVIPSARELGIPPERLNVNGGAIAVGHPFGSTGARITSTLINALSSRDAEIGVATMCVGGGQGMAMVVQRLA
ncbi:acetyl-CoA C-acetyltransferase [Spongiactinospora sp. TRM90649]|uniref:acetyl-CoA C-acetyltransferase n=1 Tax=Spongiactinospora sp. TRM90649 TaxID=3031114 RepID=UPI0023F6B593|nr:acetyl-CoA C-acetyltransferase [Spongiactinospora sp. TRM90649]MDF5758305.1 acetyl-CoA C-acetyltransferase [Spongiactinospora sp. TRM90649]